MRTLLSFSHICRFGLMTAALTGCAAESKPDQYQKSVLEKLPFLYKMTVQQGNVLTPELVDQLQIGMNQRQVRYLLGTPVLTDFFNTNRWDYVYTMRRGRGPEERRRLALFFENEVLVRIEGDMTPTPGRTPADKPKDVVVEVPDYQQPKGWFQRGMNSVGVGRDK